MYSNHRIQNQERKERPPKAKKLIVLIGHLVGPVLCLLGDSSRHSCFSGETAQAVAGGRINATALLLSTVVNTKTDSEPRGCIHCSLPILSNRVRPANGSYGVSTVRVSCSCALALRVLLICPVAPSFCELSLGCSLLVTLLCLLLLNTTRINPERATVAASSSFHSVSA